MALWVCNIVFFLSFNTLSIQAFLFVYVVIISYDKM